MMARCPVLASLVLAPGVAAAQSVAAVRRTPPAPISCLPPIRRDASLFDDHGEHGRNRRSRVG